VATPAYKFLPHTTDAYIEAAGSTFEEALENAGLSLFDTMCDLKSISPRIVDSIHAKGADEIALLYDWLESLLLKFELEGKVYCDLHVSPVKKTAGGLRLNAKARGEPYSREKHSSKVEVKAVTYHRMEVLREDGRTTLRFILDL
jgi:SHS2 domain-containing protein